MALTSLGHRHRRRAVRSVAGQVLPPVGERVDALCAVTLSLRRPVVSAVPIPQPWMSLATSSGATTTCLVARYQA